MVEFQASLGYGVRPSPEPKTKQRTPVLLLSDCLTLILGFDLKFFPGSFEFIICFIHT